MRAIKVKPHKRAYPKSKSALRYPGEKVLVQGYQRKLTVGEDYLRIRVRDPSALRRRGFKRFRNVPLSKAKGISDAERVVLEKLHARVIIAFRGKRDDGEGRVQAYLLPLPGGA